MFIFPHLIIELGEIILNRTARITDFESGVGARV